MKVTIYDLNLEDIETIKEAFPEANIHVRFAYEELIEITTTTFNIKVSGHGIDWTEITATQKRINTLREAGYTVTIL